MQLLHPGLRAASTAGQRRAASAKTPSSPDCRVRHSSPARQGQTYRPLRYLTPCQPLCRAVRETGRYMNFVTDTRGDSPDEAEGLGWGCTGREWREGEKIESEGQGVRGRGRKQGQVSRSVCPYTVSFTTFLAPLYLLVSIISSFRVTRVLLLLKSFTNNLVCEIGHIYNTHTSGRRRSTRTAEHTSPPRTREISPNFSTSQDLPPRGLRGVG